MSLPKPTIQAMTPLLQVFDMARSIHFYCEILGFELTATSTSTGSTDRVDFTWGLLQWGPASLMLNTAYDEGERPAEPDPQREQSHADTTLYFQCPNADAFYAYLQSRRHPASPPFDTYYDMRQVCTKDPDGYELCFQHTLP